MAKFGSRSNHEVFRLRRHVIPEIIETNLLVGDVRDVGVVRRATLLRFHVRLNHPDRQTQRAVHATHPLASRLAR